MDSLELNPPSNAIPPLQILVVEDEWIILESTAGMLEDLGHQVWRAGSGEDALALLEHHRVDAVITDFAMPEMNGSALAKAIFVNRPKLPIIMATGYDELPHNEGDNFKRLAKPYTQHDLRRVIADIFSSSQLIGD